MGAEIELPRAVCFVGNVATGLGGAIHVAKGLFDVGVSGAYFESNQAQVGGAIYVSSAADQGANIERYVFQGNRASDGGGVYLATMLGTDRIADSVFRDNHAGTCPKHYIYFSWYYRPSPHVAGNKLDVCDV